MTMTLSKPRGTAALDQTDAPQLEALFQQHWGRVCSLLYRMLGDWAEAEDLALEVFVRLYRRPPSEQRNLSGWLYRVAANLGFNALRARQRRLKYEQEAGMAVIETDPPADPAASLEHAQERQQVRLALAAMKPRSAKILVLRYSGLSYAEIAAALSVAPSSVGTLLARAEQEFEKLYAKISSSE
jgi:RNA polymerase sigma-70 factor (ECF subfamily)